MQYRNTVQMSYILEEALYKLDLEVGLLIEKGWIPIGSASIIKGITYYGEGECFAASQTLVKANEEEKSNLLVDIFSPKHIRDANDKSLEIPSFSD